jgi:HlyD family secretion protein
VKGLSLTEEQQRKLDPVLADARQQMRELQGLPEQERQGRAQKIREASRVRIREILTPEQRARYDEFAGSGGGDPRSGAPGRVWVLEGDKPKAISVTLGISDGAFTEILRGDLQEGQEVVVGTAAAAPGQRPSGGGGPGGGSGPGAGPRLRL